MTKQLNKAIGVTASGSRHTKFPSQEDSQKVANVLRGVRPYSLQPGRECFGLPSIHRSPFKKIDRAIMTTFLKRNIKRIYIGQDIAVEEEEEEDEGEEDREAIDAPDFPDAECLA